MLRRLVCFKRHSRRSLVGTALAASRHVSGGGNSCNVVKSPAPAIELPKHDLFTTIWEKFSNIGNRIAIVDGITGTQCSYSELEENICKFSSGLGRLGIGKGSVVCIVSPNNPEYPVAFLGILRCGAIVSTCNPAFTARELGFQFKNSDAKIVITVPECLPVVQKAIDICQVKKIIVIDTNDPQNTFSSSSVVSYQSLLREPVAITDAVQRDIHDIAVLPYSSGTTGFPKGVMLSNSNVSCNILQMIHPEFFDYRSSDSTCLMGVLPFFHIYGMVVVLLSSLYSGSKLVCLPKFEPESFLNAINRYRINVAHLVPPLVLFLSKHPLVDRYDLSSLHDVVTGAAPLGGEVVRAAVKRTGCKVIRQAYGLTETSPVTHLMPRSLGIQYPGSIGSCLRSVQAKIVGSEGSEALPPNEEGELWISGPNVMQGYLNNPEATGESVVDGRWFKTGDIGKLETGGGCLKKTS